MKRTVLVVVLLVLCMCFAFAQGSSEPATSGSTSGSSTPKAGGTLKVYISNDPASLDNTTFRATQTCGFYETILYKDAEGAYHGRLVKGYKADMANLTYTLDMLDVPVYFHDGTEMTADVLAWNINEYKKVGVFASSFNKINFAEAKDSKTVVIHMKEWDMLIPNCLARMCTPVSKAFIEKYGYEGLKENECGTGPFMLKKWTRDSVVETVKFAKYYLGEPLLDGVDYVIITDAEVALMAFESGEVDVLNSARINNEKVADLKGDSSVAVYTAARGGSAYTLGFHTTDPNDPFYDVNVRKAACYAIDADAIGMGITDGMFFPGQTQWSKDGYAYCSPNVKGFEYNPTKAKELLAAAGYPNGFKTSIKVQTPFVGTAVYVQDYLKAVGIEAEIQQIDTAAFSNYISGWNGGMMIHTVGVSNGQEYQLLTAARSDNPSGYGARSFKHSPELDALVKQAYNSDVEGSWAPTQRAAEIWFQEDVSAYVLFLSQGWVAAKTYVKDAGITQNGDTTMATLHKAWLDK
jgi:peptide/nickel transport system substrate-binding protein